MKKSNMKSILETAYKERYGVAAINVSNMETVLAVLAAADHLDQPVILQIAPMQRKVQGFSYRGMVQMIDTMAQDFEKGEYCIHLDHCENAEECMEAAEAGFDSVMLDLSHGSEAENQQEVGRLKQTLPNICVEAELGRVGGNEGTGEGEKMVLTEPQTAQSFISKTKVDCLAVAIGNAHGIYKGEPKLRFDVLKRIVEETEIPLVLHGASGISEKNLKEATALGIAKINFFTTLDRVFCQGLQEGLEKGEMMMMVQNRAQKKMQQKVEELIQICSGGKLNA